MSRGLRSLIFIFSFSALLLTHHPLLRADVHSQEADKWKEYALKLNAEDLHKRHEAESALRSTPNLNSTLKAALKSSSSQEQKTAESVIGALRISSLLPEMIQQAHTHSGRETFATLGRLISPESEGQVSQVFIDRLFKTKTEELSPGSKVEILAGFRNISKSLLSPIQLESLLQDANPQVRVSATTLAGEYRVDRQLETYDSVLLSALKVKPAQVRLEALDWISQTTATASIRSKLSACKTDPNEQVREQCSKVSKP